MLAVLEAPQLYAWMYIRVPVYMYRIEIIGAAGVKKARAIQIPANRLRARERGFDTAE